MTRSTDHVIKAGHQSADDPFSFILSTEAVDHMGDIIRQKGWDLSLFKAGNPIALFGHDHSFPIGTWKNVRVEGKRLLGELVLAKQGTSQRIDEIRSLIEQGVLKAVSVGFRIKDYEPIDKTEPFGGWDIKESLLLETSVVTVPANPEALSTVKALGISRETQKMVFSQAGLTSTPKAKSPSADTVTSRKNYSDILGVSSDELRAATLGY